MEKHGLLIGRVAAVYFIALLGVFIFFRSAYGMEEIYAFKQGGSLPAAKLIQGIDGNFYGTTTWGGSNSPFGTLFKMTPSGNLITLVSFSGTNGSGPAAGLVQGSDGILYGTTKLGAIGNVLNGYGTVFKVTTNGDFTPLVSFGNTNGANPVGDLIQANDGNFYGTTFSGGDNEQGTIFRITPAGLMTTLASLVVSVGSNPAAGLVQAADGNFYGTTSAGGANGTGTIFKMTPGGALTAIYTFSPVNAYGQNADGAYPKASLIKGNDGNFYGTTSEGGNTGAPFDYGNYGTVFKVTTNGVLTTLVNLGSTNAPGSTPNASLIQGTDGNFYGTTAAGALFGTNSYIQGTLFRMTPAGVFTVLVKCSNANGVNPQASLIQANDGNFYGTTFQGGIAGLGTIFKLTSGGILTVLNTFVNSNGRYPRGLIQGGNGNFYGVTLNDGPKGGGTVFEITPSGSFTTLASFDWQNQFNINAGVWPQAALIRGRDGNFYGTTFSGGALLGNPGGTVFKITPTGVLTTLASFTDSSNDQLAEASLVEGSDGNFYGTTRDGGLNTYGSVFKVTTNGVLSRLASLPSGSSPYAGLVEGLDGNFYGTSRTGGSFGRGMIYRVTPAGVLTTWASFSTTQGSHPEAAIILGSDGNFYGTTADGGASNEGTVFKMTPAGALTTLVSFGDDKGSHPQSPLIQANDGNFYGTTTTYTYININPFEIVTGWGTVFRMTSAGVFTTLEIFSKNRLDTLAPNTGFGGRTPLTQGTDGNIYGTTYGGGPAGGGNIFRVFTSLNFRRLGNGLVLSWSTNPPGFTLQSTTNLAPPVSWNNSADMPSVVGGQFTVTNSNSGPPMFYRLKK